MADATNALNAAAYSLLFALCLAVQAQAADSQHPVGHDHPAAPAWPVQADSEILLKASFELLNGRNSVVTERDFRGRYLLLSFGFSSCKHVCPTILRDWSRMMALLPEAKAGHLRAVMISLDPERDSPEHMDRYSKSFDPRFIGLSGSTQQVARAAENFRVTYHKVPVGDDYQINHTSMSYLVDPQGQVIDYFGFGTSSERLAEAIAHHIP